MLPLPYLPSTINAHPSILLTTPVSAPLPSPPPSSHTRNHPNLHRNQPRNHQKEETMSAAPLLQDYEAAENLAARSSHSDGEEKRIRFGGLDGEKQEESHVSILNEKGSSEDNASQGKKTKKKARDSSDLAPPRVRPLDARSLADAAEVLAHDLKDTELASAAKEFAAKARNFADQTGNPSARWWFMMGGKNLAGAAVDTPYASMVEDVLIAADLVLAANPLSASSASKSSWIERLRLAISPQDPLLPVQDPDAEGKLIGKRQILYALALSAPVPLVTSAAGLKLFPETWALVGGAGVAVWILATGGMVFNQYGRLDWEKLAARHLSYLGVLGATLVFSFYVYRAFFPSVPSALAFLVVLAICSVCIPWVMSCIRGDDVIPEKDKD